MADLDVRSDFLCKLLHLSLFAFLDLLTLGAWEGQDR